MPQKPSPLDRQVGGSHYVSKVQHVTFCQRNRIPWCEAAAVKYIIRHRKKNGKQDLEKAIHYIDLCIHEDYIESEVNPVGMDPGNFLVPTNVFLTANGVKSDSPEWKAVTTLLSHQKVHGESTLLNAKRILEKLLKDYPELDGSELL